MIPIFLVAAGALALLATGGKKSSSGSQSVEGLAADAALDEIIDDDFSLPEGIVAIVQYAGGGSAPRPPREGQPKTRAGAKRTKAKRMQIKLPKVARVNWQRELKGGRNGTSSSTPRLDRPQCELPAAPSQMVINQAAFALHVKGDAALRLLPKTAKLALAEIPAPRKNFNRN